MQWLQLNPQQSRLNFEKRDSTNYADQLHTPSANVNVIPEAFELVTSTEIPAALNAVSKAAATAPAEALLA